GGEYPYWIAVRGDDRAYVSSPRDREIAVIQLRPKLSIVNRIAIAGQPNRILLNREQDLLFAAVDNADAVVVVDTETEQVIGSVPVAAPPGLLPEKNVPKGANPNSLALSPDEHTLYVTNGGTSSIAVVTLQQSGLGKVTGLIPTGWY